MTAIAAIKLTIAELKPAPIEIENQEDKPPNTSVYDNNFMVSDKTLFLTLATLIVAIFAGYSLGPMLTHYLAMPNGASLVMQALTGTGVSFFAISFYVQNTKKDFSFLNGMIFFAMVGIIVLPLVNVFFIESSFVSLAISFATVLTMGAFMLSQMSAIINGGETNYISATVDLYLALHNMFTSLLHILGAFGDD
jgi:modulator of FtsH protease